MKGIKMAGERIQKDADKVVDDYIDKKWMEANDRFLKEKHGKGCGCNTCARQAVRDKNQWDDVLTQGNSPVKARVEWRKGKRRLTLRANPDFDGGENEE